MSEGKGSVICSEYIEGEWISQVVLINSKVSDSSIFSISSITIYSSLDSYLASY